MILSKPPVFIELDNEASVIWNNFQRFSEDRTNRNRSKFIELMHDMEQYMIGVSRKDAEIASLDEYYGIFRIDRRDIGRLYDPNVGFVLQI